jgi:hypothetical protein
MIGAKRRWLSAGYFWGSLISLVVSGRRVGPFSTRRWALLRMRSRMASAMV